MKRIRPGRILLAAVVATVALSADATTLPNAGFESGNFASWDLNIQRGQPRHNGRKKDAGTASVVHSWNVPGGTTRLPMGGNSFALLGSLASGNFSGSRTYNVTLSREIELEAGDLLSGWAFFYNGDDRPQDCAWVKIFDCDGDEIATPWIEWSGMPGDCNDSIPLYAASPWTQWEWSAELAGTYTLRLGLTTRDDDTKASYGGFDALLCTPATEVVPEPSAAAVLLYGLGALVTFRRWVCRR